MPALPIATTKKTIESRLASWQYLAASDFQRRGSTYSSNSSACALVTPLTVQCSVGSKWHHLVCTWKMLDNLPQFTEEKDEKYDDNDENCEIGCERILSWRTEGIYDVFRHM